MARMSTTPAPEVGARRRGARTKGDIREEQILAVTRDLLMTRPMGEVTIDEIASAAGISRTSFYFYFASKQAVLATLMEHTWDELSGTHDWFDADGPDPEGLARQLDAVAAIWRANGAILACSTHHAGYEPLREFIDRARRRFVDRLAAKIERDRRTGAAPAGPDAAELASLIANMRDGRLAELTAPGNNDSPAATDSALAAVATATLRIIYGST